MQQPSNETAINLKTLFNKGLYYDAEKLANSIIKQYPKYQFGWKILGILFIKNRKLVQAIDANKKAIELIPQDASLYNNLGVAQKELGMLKNAEINFRKAIYINKNYPEGYFNLANVLNILNRKHEAHTFYLETIRLNPNYFEAIINMGVTLLEIKEYSKSVAYFKKAIELKPSFYITYNYLGNSYIEMGKVDKAIRVLCQAIEKKSSYEEAWNNIYYPLRIIKNKNKNNKAFINLINTSNFGQDNLRLKILNLKLNLGNINANYHLKEAIDVINILKINKIKNPYFLNSTPKKKSKLPCNIINLIHFGRSGTGLLHSLLDNHSEISTIPSFYLSEFFDILNWENLTKNGWIHIVDKFIAKYPVLFDSRETYPVPSINKGKISSLGIKEGLINLGNSKKEFLTVDKDKFKKELICLMHQHEYLGQGTFFKMIHVAFDKVLGVSCEDKKNTIFYHIHNPDICAKLNFIKIYPEAKWIAMVRNPVDSCESWSYDYFLENNYSEIVMNIKTMLYEIDNVITKGKNIVGIRLEDLKGNPKKTIKALCKWMNITEEDSLYDMTAQGKKWWGDLSCFDKKPFGKISNEKKGKVFSRKDKFILETLFYPFNLRFGYTNKNKNFKKDIDTIYPMMFALFDFEKKISKRMKVDYEDFMETGYYKYLRIIMKERWNILRQYYTYPGMIKPLKLD